MGQFESHVFISKAESREELCRELKSVADFILRGDNKGSYAKMTSSICGEFTVVCPESGAEESFLPRGDSVSDVRAEH